MTDKQADKERNCLSEITEAAEVVFNVLGGAFTLFFFVRQMTVCAGSEERCVAVMLPNACQNLHSWNVNDTEQEL